METKIITEASAFLKERYKYFEDNVLPKTNAIMDVMLNTERFVKKCWVDYGKYVYKYNGIKFVFDYIVERLNGKSSIKEYTLKLKHKFKTVLHYRYIKGGDIKLYRFHECEWMQRLGGAIEKIQAHDLTLVEKHFEKRCEKYKRRC